MTIEERLKELIIERYGTVKDFAIASTLPYGTVDTILRRGVNKASVTNIITICKTLRISTDELAHGKIVPIETVSKPNLPVMDLDSVLSYIRVNSHDFADLSVDGKVLTKDELDYFLFALECGIMLIRKRREDSK